MGTWFDFCDRINGIARIDRMKAFVVGAVQASQRLDPFDP
jgi:hypothetical protein